MPLEQTGNAITFYAFFTNSGAGATGLTVTADVWEVELDGSATELQSAAGATEIGDGLYRYILASGSVDAEGEYLAVFKTSGTVDQAHIAAIWVINRAGVENLDAAMTSRSTFDPTSDAVAEVTLVVTTTTNTDMRGTDSAALAATALTSATWTDARAGYLDELAAGNIPSDLDDVLTETGTTIPALIAALNDPTAAVIAGAVHDEVIEGALTYRQITRIVLAVLAGISTGGGTTSVAFRNVADDADRVAATTTAVGNRTAVTLDGS